MTDANELNGSVTGISLSGDAAQDTAPAAPNPDDFVDPWNVVSNSDTGVDYDKLISNNRNLPVHPK